MSTTLETELETFRRELPRLLTDPANRGKYVLIKGDKVLGVYPTLREAVDAGYGLVGVSTPFLANRIIEHEEPLYFPRNLTRCP
jgi:hypothetical protein